MSNAYTYACFGLILSPDELETFRHTVIQGSPNLPDRSLDTGVGLVIAGPTDESGTAIEVGVTAAEGWMDIDLLNSRLMNFMRQEQLPGSICYTYSYTVDRPSYGDYGGGVSIVSRENILNHDVHQIASAEMAARTGNKDTYACFLPQSESMRTPGITSPTQAALAQLESVEDCMSALRDAVNGLRRINHGR